MSPKQHIIGLHIDLESVINKTKDLGLSNFQDQIEPRIYLNSNITPFACVTDRVNELCLCNPWNDGKRRIVLSEEACANVWYTSFQFTYIYYLLSKTCGQHSLDVAKDSSVLDDDAYETIIDKVYDVFAKFFPYVLDKKYSSILADKGIEFEIPTDSLWSRDCLINDTSELTLIQDKVAKFALSYVICHELSHVYFQHRSYFLQDNPWKQETEADKFAIQQLSEPLSDDDLFVFMLGVLAWQYFVLATQVLTEKCHPDYPENRTHPDDDIRLFLLFDNVLQGSPYANLLADILFCALGVWARAFKEDDYPVHSAVSIPSLSEIRDFMSSRKRKCQR